jgi:MoxR-like ATPase
MSLTRKQKTFLHAMHDAGVMVESNDWYDRSVLVDVATSIGMKHPPAWITQSEDRKTTNRGQYSIPEYRALIESTPDPDFGTVNGNSPEPIRQEEPTVSSIPATSMALAQTAGERATLIPDRMTDYVAWGHYRPIVKIIESSMFAPIFVTGLSGNGKTTMIEQACAKTQRECFRVNITQETDEDDLLGGFRLINGDTAFCYGPVVEAMKRGAVLLLDEIDLASSKIMCLQPVLEGKGVFVKKIGEWIQPAPGFTVIATANTKGKGDNDGRFIGTNVLNEAFLDRFDWTMEQDYASRATETKIVVKKMEKFGKVDADFADYLTRWAEITRKAYKEGAIDEIITTRRLENISKAFSIFGDRKMAVSLALARFDDETQQAFWSLYEKVDESIREEATETVTTETVTTETVTTEGESISDTALNA